MSGLACNCHTNHGQPVTELLQTWSESRGRTQKDSMPGRCRPAGHASSRAGIPVKKKLGQCSGDRVLLADVGRTGHFDRPSPRRTGCSYHSCCSRRLRGTSESGGLMPPAPQLPGPEGGYGAGPGGSAVAQDNRLGRRRRDSSRDRTSEITSKTLSLQSSMNLLWLIPTQRPSHDTARAQPRAAGITAGAAGDRPGPPGVNAPPGPQASLAAGLRLGLKLFSSRLFQVAAT